MNTDNMITGGCLCNSISYRVTGDLRSVVACHCLQCQKTSGNFVAATRANKADLTLLKSSTLKWFNSSETAKRGFCGDCGSNLFWQSTGSEFISIFAGTLDQPTGLSLSKHIFVDYKSDYYQLNDDLPKFKISDL